ncbi:MAG TPA: hypothetical protein VH012_03945 [Acidimicrobiales bacterium]|jgi:hypothetical protein|nr:hypothetical protein [Acidimicrobiales bacterium]
MASAMVFVDDAVLGHLPPVCAKTGAETPDRLVMTVPVGRDEGLGIAWLLLLAGPIGWLGLFLYAISRRDETLTVKLPYSDAAYHDLARARRDRRNAGIATIVLPVMALIVLIPQSYFARAAAAALVVVAIGSFCVYIAETIHVRRAAVRVDLDASRRWVTLSRISDPLAEAITRQTASRTAPRMDASRGL